MSENPHPCAISAMVRGIGWIFKGNPATREPPGQNETVKRGILFGENRIGVSDAYSNDIGYFCPSMSGSASFASTTERICLSNGAFKFETRTVALPIVLAKDSPISRARDCRPFPPLWKPSSQRAMAVLRLSKAPDHRPPVRPSRDARSTRGFHRSVRVARDAEP